MCLENVHFKKEKNFIAHFWTSLSNESVLQLLILVRTMFSSDHPNPQRSFLKKPKDENIVPAALQFSFL